MLVNVGITLFLKLVKKKKNLKFLVYLMGIWQVPFRYHRKKNKKKTNDSFHAVKLTDRQGSLQKFKTPLALVSGSLIADKAPILGLYLMCEHTYVDQDVILTLKEWA